MRGKVAELNAFRAAMRITPACAGKRRCRAKMRSGRWDHPRVCGEKLDIDSAPARHWGSPPRVRGKGNVGFTAKDKVGITPACAGKRNSGNLCLTITGDHPRVCGEKTQTGAAVVSPLGSPPRVRGKVLSLQRKKSKQRITPACAGKRYRRFYRWSFHRDHPRVCGEKTKESLKK